MAQLGNTQINGSLLVTDKIATNTFYGDLQGTASDSLQTEKLKTSRTIEGWSFDGTSNISKLIVDSNEAVSLPSYSTDQRSYTVSGSITLEQGCRVAIYFVEDWEISWHPLISINGSAYFPVLKKTGDYDGISGSKFSAGTVIYLTLVTGYDPTTNDEEYQWILHDTPITKSVYNYNFATTTNSNYPVLLDDETAVSTTYKINFYCARKSSKLLFNPSTGILTATKFSGTATAAEKLIWNEY